MKALPDQDSTAKVSPEYDADGESKVESQFLNFDTPQDGVDYLVKVWYKNYKGYTGVETDSKDANEVADKLQSEGYATDPNYCLLYTSPSPRDRTRSRMPSSA